MDKLNKLQLLKKKWDKKLKDSGFDDAEDINGNLKVWTSFARFSDPKKSLVIERDAKEEYYRLAGFFLNDYKFRTNLEKLIWEKHSNGISLREISKILKLKNIDLNKDKLNKLIRKFSQQMLEIYKVQNE